MHRCLKINNYTKLVEEETCFLGKTREENEYLSTYLHEHITSNLSIAVVRLTIVQHVRLSHFAPKRRSWPTSCIIKPTLGRDRDPRDKSNLNIFMPTARLVNIWPSKIQCYHILVLREMKMSVVGKIYFMGIYIRKIYTYVPKILVYERYNYNNILAGSLTKTLLQKTAVDVNIYLY